MIRERHLGGMLVRVECADERARQADDILGVVATLPKAEIVAGTSFRFGWSRLRLISDGRALRVAEPDFAKWPQDEWEPTVDITLDVLSLQVALLHRIGEKGVDVWLDQLLIVASEALSVSDLYVRRTQSRSTEDSGWLLATLADPEALTRGEGLEAIAIATLVTRRRAILQALTLPVGFTAIFDGERLTEILDGAGRPRLGGR